MRNWAGNHTYRARTLHEPASIEEVQEVVRGSTRVRPLGSRHSFNDIGDTDGGLVSLARLPRVLQVDADARTATIDGGARYGDICEAVHRAGLAFHNMASLPHISVAGACATATHGSGARSPNLSTAVRSLAIVLADGELVTIDRDADRELWTAAVVSLGALGIVVRLTLDAEATYQVRQTVFEDLPLDDFTEHFDTIATLADSVSFFTEWRGRDVDQVWLKERVRDGASGESPATLYGATRATAERHPIRHRSPVACTPQLGVPGPWHERLPHFRMEFTPSSGDELQSEYFVPREHAVDAFLALDRLRTRIAAVVQVSEIRTIAGDELWLSPAFGRDTAAFHFTWQPDPEAVGALLPDIEAALRPYAPRPHWAKLFTLNRDELWERYARLAEFSALVARWDPDGTFRNDYLRRLVVDG